MGAILSVSGRATGGQVSLSTSKFILPGKASELTPQERSQFLRQGDRHRNWSGSAKGGYQDLQQHRVTKGQAAASSLLEERPIKQATYRNESDGDTSSSGSESDDDADGGWLNQELRSEGQRGENDFLGLGDGGDDDDDDDDGRFGTARGSPLQP